MDGRTGDLLQGVNGAPEVCTKLRLGLAGHDSVPVAVTGDLVTAGVNVSNQLRVSIRHPAQDEEGGSEAPLLQEIQDPPGVFHHSRGILIPGLDAAWRAPELVVQTGSHQMEPVLHVHGQQGGWQRRECFTHSVRHPCSAP